MRHFESLRLPGIALGLMLTLLFQGGLDAPASMAQEEVQPRFAVFEILTEGATGT